MKAEFSLGFLLVVFGSHSKRQKLFSLCFFQPLSEGAGLSSVGTQHMGYSLVSNTSNQSSLYLRQTQTSYYYNRYYCQPSPFTALASEPRGSRRITDFLRLLTPPSVNWSYTSEMILAILNATVLVLSSGLLYDFSWCIYSCSPRTEGAGMDHRHDFTAW